MTTFDDQLAEPTDFVVIVPVTWTLERSAEMLEQLHGEHWFEEASYEIEPVGGGDEGFRGRGTIRLEREPEISVIVEAPIEELAEMQSRELAAQEIAQLQSHRAVWRLRTPGEGRPLPAARHTARVLGTLVEAGAPGVLVPMLRTFHSPRFIKRETMDPGAIPSLTKIFVAAWNSEDWMVTRGLTTFGLPELETPIDEGLNAAFFRLMDVASNMIMMGAPYPDDAQLQVGPKLLEVQPGPEGPEDREVPLAGHFGRLTLTTA
jgi:hypothetical protein